MPQNIRTIPASGSTDWYGHYSDIDLAARELQNIQGSLAATGFKAATVPDPSVVQNQQTSLYAQRRFDKLYTPLSITLSTVVIGTTNSGSSPSGFYFAIYDGSGNLIPGSGSADWSGSLSPNTTTVALGSTVTVPAGYFFLVSKFTSASTWPQVLQTAASFNNFGTTNGNLPATATTWRGGQMSNDWSGTTPPATMGTLSSFYSTYVIGVR